jgi:glycosyltransferase involved in cell wall biosynthesis
VPFAKRRGLFFVGQFEHFPNVEAMEFLCRDVLPQFDPATLANHPVYIVGNGMTDRVRKCAAGLPFVRVLGWVPSIVPYLERVRVSLAPLLHGAGTKRKVIQPLAVGTPVVSTSIGAEGLDLRDGEEILIADDAVAFANAMARLLQDGDLWERLARQGRDVVLAGHSRQIGRESLLQAISSVLPNGARLPASSRSGGAPQGSYLEYRQIVLRTQEVVCRTVPARATVIVVSRGDNALLNLDDRDAWHFPRITDGTYAGHYPASSAEAIAHLEALRGQGGDFLVFPKTAFWWLEHYSDFKQHLESHYRIAAHDSNSCIVFSLRELPVATSAEPKTMTRAVEDADLGHQRLPGSTERSPSSEIQSRRACVRIEGEPVALAKGARRPKVLVVGAYLADGLSSIDDLVHTLSQSKMCCVVQRWAALRGEPPTKRVAAATALKIGESKPTFEIVNQLLGRQPFSEFDYVLVCNDDAILPHGFLDQFISLQSALGFSMARPALTPGSFVDHPIVERQRGVIARETSFAEFGPVVSFHRSIFPLVFPLDLTGPTTWGSETVWTSRLGDAGKTMGIIDAAPVDPNLRGSTFSQRSEKTNGQRVHQGNGQSEDPYLLLAVGTRTGSNGKSGVRLQPIRKNRGQPRISVVIPTHNRAALLEHSLKSLTRQTLPASDFEVILVDDGSTDRTSDVCEKWSSRLPLVRTRIERSGIAAAKNIGIFAATSPIILFFDDDDVADENLLAEHLRTHARYPLENVGVLGYTDWAPSLKISEVMRYVTDIGHFLFSYSDLADGQRLDFTYFWGGRSSCKKSLLTRTGIFREQFEFGSEDIEAAFRISKLLVERRLHRSIEVDKDDEELKRRLSTLGVAVIFNRKAVQHMNRALTYDDFCRRCERQGRSQQQFSQLYTDSIVHDWCQTTDAAGRWRTAHGFLPAKVARVHDIEAMLKAGLDAKERPILLEELHGLYEWTFNAFKAKGIVEFQGVSGTPRETMQRGARRTVLDRGHGDATSVKRPLQSESAR